MAKYKCKHCGKVVERDSTKKWIKSVCMEKMRDVHLVLVDEPLSTRQEAIDVKK